MAIRHLFPNASVPFAVGQRLVAPVSDTVTYTVADFVQNLTDAAVGYRWTWDWGDGTIDSGVGATQTHAYMNPARYTLILQTNVDGAVQVWSGQIEVVLKVDRFATDAEVVLPWVAAAQATFRSDGATRHAVMPLPQQCAAALTDAPPPQMAVGEWGTPGALTPTAGELAQAVDDAATRWQNAYATGFGRMPMPREDLEWGVWAHTAMDAVAVGINDNLIADLTGIETTWREVVRAPSVGHRLQTLASNLSTLTANQGNLIGDLTRLGWSAETTEYLGAGERSVRMADAMRWLEYKLRETDDSVAVDSVTTARWRRLAQLYADHLPEIDYDTAWAWEVAQAAIQTVYAFYSRLGTRANTVNAQILVVGNPQTRHVGLKLVDAVQGIWAAWTAGPGTSIDDTPSLADLVAEGGSADGPFVRSRGVAVRAATPPAPWAWDMRRFESLLAALPRMADPIFDSVAASTLTTMTAQTGLTPIRAILPDGATRTYVEPTDSGLLAADVTRPGLPLSQFDWARGGLRPHAAYLLWSQQQRQGRAPVRSDRGLNLPTIAAMPRTQSVLMK